MSSPAQSGRSTWPIRSRRQLTAGWDGRTASGKAKRWSMDTKGFNGMAWFDRAGNFASEGLHVVERITARSPETLNYEATIEDPRTCSPSRGRSACRSIGAWSERADRGVPVRGVLGGSRVRPPGQATSPSRTQGSAIRAQESGDQESAFFRALSIEHS